MRILLTGASGFIGRHLKEKVKCLSLEDENGQIDIRDRTRVVRAVSEIQPDGVIHLAAQSFIPESFKDPQETFSVNFLGTLSLLEALKANNFSGKMLYVGSADVYGLVDPSSLPISEDHPLHPRSPYAVSKVAAEALCYQWSQTGTFPIVLSRPFNQIGSGQDPRFAIANFARQIMNIRRGHRPQKIEVGDIDVTRDFTDIDDAVEAFLCLLKSGRNGEVYNVCSGKELSIRYLIESMLKLSGVDAEIIIDQNRLRLSEQRRVCGNPQKINSEIHWHPRIPLEETLKRIIS